MNFLARLLQIVLVNVLGKLIGVASDFLGRLFRRNKRNKKIDNQIKNLKEAIEKHDDDKTPLTEEQKRSVIDAARVVVSDF